MPGLPGKEDAERMVGYMLNRASVQGRFVADPELRKTQSDSSVCSFRIAWSEKRNDTERKLFLDCTAWRGLGEMVSKYFTKGKEVIVEGQLHTDSWETDEGQKRSAIKMTADKVHFCGPKDGGAPAPAESPHFEDVDIDDGDLPF